MYVTRHNSIGRILRALYAFGNIASYPGRYRDTYKNIEALNDCECDKIKLVLFPNLVFAAHG